MNKLEEQRAKLETLVNNQIDPVSGLAINCHNCIHCERDRLGAQFDVCMKCGGKYCTIVHQFPSTNRHLCKNYSAWSPRQKTIPELITDKIRNFLTSN